MAHPNHQVLCRRIAISQWIESIMFISGMKIAASIQNIEERN
jgi:hypothetical protein